MGWIENDGIDYNDAKRPTADDPTQKTGWIAYYASDRSGAGLFKPHYVWMGENAEAMEHSDLRDHIVHEYETWMEHAGYGYLTIHRGVTPPQDVIEKQLERAENNVLAAIKNAEAVRARLRALYPDANPEGKAWGWLQQVHWVDALDAGSVERGATCPKHYIESVQCPSITTSIVRADVVTPLYAGTPVRRPNPHPGAPPDEENAL